jgi:hypothetical protein
MFSMLRDEEIRMRLVMVERELREPADRRRGVAVVDVDGLLGGADRRISLFQNLAVELLLAAEVVDHPLGRALLAAISSAARRRAMIRELPDLGISARVRSASQLPLGRRSRLVAIARTPQRDIRRSYPGAGRRAHRAQMPR